jgi:hypothetical protein
MGSAQGLNIQDIRINTLLIPTERLTRKVSCTISDIEITESQRRDIKISIIGLYTSNRCLSNDIHQVNNLTLYFTPKGSSLPTDNRRA